MRLLIASTVLILAACSAPDEAEDTEMAVEETAEVAALIFDGGSPFGTFEAVSVDGTRLVQTTTDDGKVVSVDADGNEVAGTFTFEVDTFCITNEGDEQGACYGYSDLQEDGSWSATNVDNAEDVWTVRRMSE